MSSEEEKIKADMAAAEAALKGAGTPIVGTVKMRMVWIVGILAAFVGFVVGHVLK